MRGGLSAGEPKRAVGLGALSHDRCQGFLPFSVDAARLRLEAGGLVVGADLVSERLQLASVLL